MDRSFAQPHRPGKSVVYPAGAAATKSRLNAPSRFPYDTGPALTKLETTFTVAELEVALRWAELVGRDGHRVTIRLDCPGVEEMLLVRRSGLQAPAFVIRPLGSAVMMEDAIGLRMPFLTLTDALLALSPVLGRNRRSLINGPRAACILELPGFLVAPQAQFGSRLCGAVQVCGRQARRILGFCLRRLRADPIRATVSQSA